MPRFVQARERRKEQAFVKPAPPPPDDSKRLATLKVTAKDCFFDTESAQALLDTFETHPGRLQAVAQVSGVEVVVVVVWAGHDELMLYRGTCVCWQLAPRLANRFEIRDFVVRNMPEKRHQDALARLMGKLFNFDPHNITGRYCLRLDSPFERALAIRLIECSNDESAHLRSKRLPDTSPFGNWSRWRNETLDGEPFVFHEAWTLPDVGILQFDYVSSRRVFEDSRHIKQATLRTLVQGLALRGPGIDHAIEVQVPN